MNERYPLSLLLTLVGAVTAVFPWYSKNVSGLFNPIPAIVGPAIAILGMYAMWNLPKEKNMLIDLKIITLGVLAGLGNAFLLLSIH